jgi:hypothetical protein
MGIKYMNTVHMCTHTIYGQRIAHETRGPGHGGIVRVAMYAFTFACLYYFLFIRENLRSVHQG